MKNRTKTIINLVLASGTLTLIAHNTEYVFNVALWSVFGVIKTLSIK